MTDIIENELDNFKNYLIKIDLAINTAYNYTLDIKHFFKWNTQNETLDLELINDYKIDLINDYSIKTVNRRVNALNKYLEFKNVDLHIKSEKIQAQTFIDDMLSNEEASAMLKAMREKNDKRAIALFLGLFYTGARVSELLQLKPRNLSKNEVTIKGKGDKYRKILVPDILNSVLNDYYNNRKYDSDKLFSGERGAITRSTVLRILKRYAKLANVDKDKVYPHAIRHLYSKNLASMGVSYSAIKQLLGHSLSTTDIYMQLSKRELLDIINSIKL